MDQDLELWLAQNEIEYISFSHSAVYTVEEASEFYGEIPGLHCKNLFLKDSKRKMYFLVSLPFDRKIPLRELRKLIGAKKISFASPEDLKLILGLQPGSVTPFGLLHVPSDIKITFVIDQTIVKSDYVCFHPNTNTATLSIPQNSFQKVLSTFMDVLHIKVMIINGSQYRSDIS